MNLRAGLLIALVLTAPCAACDSGGPADGGDATLPHDATDDGADGPDSGVPGVTVDFGTGQSDYVDIPLEGGTVELIFGAQGGYHFWGRAKFRGFAPDVDVSFHVTDLENQRELHTPLPAHRYIADGVRHGLLDLGGGTYATNAEVVYLNITCGADVIGHRLDALVFVHDRATDRTASAERIVTVVDNDPSPSCVSDGSDAGSPTPDAGL